MTRRTGARGFTLLEIAVAMAIMGVGVVTCLQIFGGSLKLQRRALRDTQAVSFARAAMDVLISAPDDALIDDESLEMVQARLEGVRAQATAAGYEVRAALPTRPCPEVMAREGEDADELDLEFEAVPWCLQVDVSWQDGAGSRTYSLASVRIGPNQEDEEP
jgi:prepilin-type N-terminal cleavage/methylation domain-containing protein